MSDTPDDWTPAQNALFTRVYEHMIRNQAMFVRIGAPKVAPADWEVTAWNAAWFAATVMDGGLPVEHCDEDGAVLAVEGGGRH